MATDLDTAYRRYFPLLRGKCRRLLRTDAEAEEVAQEAFVRLIQSRASFADPRQTVAWLYKTSTHIAIDRLRARRTEPLAANDVAVPSAEAHVAAKRSLSQLAARLDEDVLAAAVLCRVDELTQPEAALVLGCSERTLRRLLAKFDAATTERA